MSKALEASILALALLAAIVAPAGAVSYKAWYTLLDGPNAEGATSIVLLPSGEIMISGITNSTGTSMFDAFIAKLSGSGSLEWAKAYDYGGNETYARITSNGAGGYYMLIQDTNAGKTYIANFTGSGGIIWSVELSLADTATLGVGISRSPDGYVLVTGAALDSTRGYYMFIAKLDPTGALASAVGLRLSITLPVTGWDIEADPNGTAYYVAGIVNPGGTVNPSDPTTHKHIIIVKVSPDLASLSYRVINYTVADYAYKIIPRNGLLYIAGEIRENAYGNDVLIAALYPSNLSSAWEKRINITNYDEAWGASWANGSIILHGAYYRTYGNMSQYDGLLASVTANGTLEWCMNLSTSKLDWILAAKPASGKIVAAGITNTSTAGASAAFAASITPGAPTTVPVPGGPTLRVTSIGTCSVSPALESSTPTYNSTIISLTPSITPATPTIIDWNPAQLHALIPEVGGNLIPHQNGPTAWPALILIIIEAILAALTIKTRYSS